MRPLELQQIGSELAIRWDGGKESFIALEILRKACPCAGCHGERDVMGQLHKGPKPVFNDQSYILKRIISVGGYAVQPIWGDGHGSGIFTYDYLRRLGSV